MTGLYTHVPFCTKKCHYCNFVIALAAPAENHDLFLEALEQEARRYEPLVKGNIFDTVYVGGGTPSVLEPDEFEWLMHILKTHFKWKPNAEITCEANPGDIDLKKALLLKKLGVNRVSLGAQSFHDETLARLNRTHRSAEIESSFRYLRDAGFSNISLDLILSLPGESWEHAQYSLEQLVKLDPEHVSIYELTVEDKTVFGELQRRGELNVPDEDMQFEILSKARLFLKEHGYRHYELLSYAKRGSESRHNLLYWANEDTLGLGPGAYTHWRGSRYRFSTSYHEYLSKVAAKDWKPAEEETLTDEKKETESFILALRVTEGVQKERFPGFLERMKDELSDLTEKGLLTEEEGHIRLTARGQFLAETVFAELSC